MAVGHRTSPRILRGCREASERGEVHGVERSILSQLVLVMADEESVVGREDVDLDAGEAEGEGVGEGRGCR